MPATRSPSPTGLSASAKVSGIGTGLSYISRATTLVLHKDLRLFVIVPLLINLVLFFILTSVLMQQFEAVVAAILGWLPGWMDFLSWLIWSLLAATVLVIYGYSFSIITNILAAPFYGLLAERAEVLLTGEAAPAESLRHMIPRTLGREMQKLGYFLSRGIAVLLLGLLLSFIPLVNLLVPVITILWGAWTMAIQYADYAADNHQLAFVELRKRLSQHRSHTYSFGGLILLSTMVPVLNIFIMPIAVVAGTCYWTDRLTLLQRPAR